MEKLSVADQDLVHRAREVMKNAYCPYSKFQVGAALRTQSGEVIVGANHENASYGGTICAERSAVVSALTQGHRKFDAIAIVTALDDPAAPCGLCRQFLVEFGNYKVILGSSTSNKIFESQVKDLLPYAFTPASLDDYNQQSTAAQK
ncbi:unnamed protein product [Caenorhabditis auriculariae]|uniref:Cytidine deaminase n=1 Tax=Caenorhabditis auriculariae TaxID=2777116 RepID=A0A8S1GWF5_9PELO|nr:unnamed protein product [Caenorhabditis auriculariae]